VYACITRCSQPSHAKEQPELVKKFVAATIHGWSTRWMLTRRAAVSSGNKLDYAMNWHDEASIPLIKADRPHRVSSRADWETCQKIAASTGFRRPVSRLSKAFIHEIK